MGKVFMEGANVAKSKPTPAPKSKPTGKIKSFEVDVADNGGFSVRVRPQSGNGDYPDSKTHVYESTEALCSWIETTFK